jgi:acetyl-CoA acetyltransferase
MTTAERARDLRQPGVAVLGAAGGMTHWNISQMGDYTTSAAAVCAPEAFARAGLRPSDVDTLQFYDSFTITVLVLLEDAGFCKKGEGGAFVAEGTCAAAASCRSTPTAADSRAAIPACAGSSC